MWFSAQFSFREQKLRIQAIAFRFDFLAALESSPIPALTSCVHLHRLLIGRPFRSLVTLRSRINWSRVGIGFGVWLLISIVSTGIDVALRPELYTWQPNWAL